MDRDERIELIQENIRLAKTDAKISECVQKSIKNQKIYWETDALAMPAKRYKKDADVFISTERSIQAAAKYKGKRVCVLNFASFVTPGGGVIRGTTAQEESICRVTSLYSSIADESVDAFYKEHKRRIAEGTISRKNNDDCIYTPNVLCYREDTFECAMLPEENRYEVSVITCAAPDQRYGCGGIDYHPSSPEQLKDFEKRIHRILTIAALNDAQVLILGAFGCGVFGNSPSIVAEAFNVQLTMFKNHFEVVEFAVYCQHRTDLNYTSFLNIESVREIGEKEKTSS